MIGVVGDIIRRCRTEAGLSQDALAERCGMSRGQISQYEKHGICPSAYRLEDMLNACGFEILVVKKTDAEVFRLKEKLK